MGTKPPEKLIVSSVLLVMVARLSLLLASLNINSLPVNSLDVNSLVVLGTVESVILPAATEDAVPLVYSGQLGHCNQRSCQNRPSMPVLALPANLAKT